MVKTVWVTRRAGESPVFDVYPAAAADGRDGAEPLYLTNAPLAFEGFFPGGAAAVADVMAVRAFACPDAPLERADQLFAEGEPPSGEGLWRAWERMAQRLDAFPLWALETVELLLRDLDERALARLFGHFAARVREAGRNCGNWTDSFRAENLRGERRTLPSHDDCTPLGVERVAAHLLPGGTFARLMPGYESRPGQVEMLRAVTRAFNEGKHLAVEAGTGVGKSLAYLLPAAAWARLNDVPVVVSTNTRNLQSQLIEKDLPLVREAVRAEAGADAAPLRVALLKGRSNYFCLRRLAVLLEHSQFELERPELRLFAEAVAWAVQTPDGDLDAFAGAGRADPVFLSKLSSLGEECPGRGCRYYRRCFLQKARARAAAAHVVIANHALVFSDLQNPGSTLPPYAQIVFDEAHNLEEAATRHLSVEVTQMRLNQMLRRLSRGKGRRAGGILEVLRNHLEKGAVTADEETAHGLRRQIRAAKAALDGVQAAARRLFERFGCLLAAGGSAARFRCVAEAEVILDAAGTAEAPVPAKREIFRDGAFAPSADRLDEGAVAEERVAFKRAIAEAAGLLIALAEALRRASEGELSLYGDQAANVEGAAALLRGFAMDTDFVLAGSDPEHVFWAEAAGRGAPGAANLFAAPLKIANALADLLYRQKLSVVFCSATLRVGGSFGYIGRRLGFDLIEPERVFTCVAESPFDYLRQCAALALTFLPEPGVAAGGGYAEQLSGLMLDVFTRTRGRAMGLFTSYEMMNQVARLLEEPLREAGIRLLVHGVNGTRDQITRVFRAGGACVLLGTHSFWEGVDVAGEALSCVVMARLPFAAVGDPIIEARSEQIDQSGGSSFREYALPQAVIRFRQGFGRLIRTRTDRGVVIVADPRVVTKNYGATFRKSLPCPVQNVASRDDLLARVEAMFPSNPAFISGARYG